MTKTLTKAALALLALGMAVPAMAATDGGLGATSTGAFTASVDVTPNTNNFVQILGLDDVTLPSFVESGSYYAGTFSFLCLNKNTTGSVILTIDQPEISYEGTWSVSNPASYVNKLSSGTNDIPVAIALMSPNGAFVPRSGAIFSIPESTTPQTCTANSGSGSAFKLQIIISSGIDGNQNNVPVGYYSNTFTLTLALPS